MTFCDPPSLPTDDRGVLLGDGLFETIRLYDGRPFRLAYHLRRLREGADVVGISVPDEIETRVETALKQWTGGDGALRITLTRGSGHGLLPSSEAPGRLLFLLRPIEFDPEILTRGVRAVIRGRVEERALTSGLKTIGYLERIQGARLAKEAGAEEALLQNSRDHLVEGTASNLFGVREGVLVAPGVREGALPGITREIVLEAAGAPSTARPVEVPGALRAPKLKEAAGQLGLRVEERGIGPEELSEFSELFLTSSLRGIVPLVEVEGRKIGTGEPGSIFHEVSERYAAVVREEIGL